MISRTEEYILLTVHQLGDDAYGISIRKQIENIMGKKFSVGAIYVPLDRLEEKGHLTSTTGAPTSERGGRRKRFFKLTPQGINALLEARQTTKAFWAATPELRIQIP
ncbi:MAG TPA: PadR family transcriptional regulator [Anaerolineales bacterium]|nr:PadR family transcriptional regulator [Anaerolineales bacterium]